jgi:catechol 2,3-dioxygenase-like lactoylglutathione lyase family enzyme
MHVNVNCSDIERSLRFYQDFVGLEARGSSASC